MSLLAAVLLGVVQGLTEFLPISSSAHLILAREFFGWHADPLVLELFDVAGHVGTLAAVVAFFWTDLWLMARALPRAVSRDPGPAGRRIRWIVIGTIPIVIVGGLWGRALEDAVRTPAIAAALLAIGGVLLLVAERARRLTKGDAAMTWQDAFTVGVAQTVALVPGVSRSGVTIATGMLLGFERATIARFSFLLSIPAVVAAAAKGGLEMRHVALTRSDLQIFAVGAATSAVVGYITVRYFIRYLSAHRLDVFAWYRIGLALATFIWLAVR